MNCFQTASNVMCIHMAPVKYWLAGSPNFEELFTCKQEMPHSLCVGLNLPCSLWLRIKLPEVTRSTSRRDTFAGSDSVAMAECWHRPMSAPPVGWVISKLRFDDSNTFLLGFFCSVCAGRSVKFVGLSPVLVIVGWFPLSNLWLAFLHQTEISGHDTDWIFIYFMCRSRFRELL